MLKTRALTLFLWALISSSLVAQPKPAMDYLSLMSGVKVHFKHPRNPKQGGVLRLNNLRGVFLPQSVHYTGQANYKFQVFASLRKDGRELKRYSFWVRPSEKVFTTFQTDAQPVPFCFRQEGQYELVFLLNNEPITRFPFRVWSKDSTDPFNPVRHTFAEGPWNEWAVLTVPDGTTSGGPSLTFWARGGSFLKGSKREYLQVSLELDGDTVFESTSKTLSKDPRSAEWRAYSVDLQFPRSEGGARIKTENLLEQDGTYVVVVKSKNKVYGKFPLQIRDGAIQPHPRQGIQYEPHADYLPGKVNSLPWARGRANNALYSLYWLPKLNEDDLKKALTSRASGNEPAPAKAARQSRPEWVVAADVDKNRPFQVVDTGVETRMDSNLAAGDGIIAFGTGSLKGVGYIDTDRGSEALSIPNGQTYNSRVFAVCGKKIVLVRDHQVVVFDTQTNHTASLPIDQIYLYRTSGDFYKKAYLAAHGNLVVTVNDPTKVSDRRIIKVIDVSGPKPYVFSINNGPYAAYEVTNATVGAASGSVAVASARKQAIFFGPVADNARLKPFDLSGFDSLRDGPLLLRDNHIAYLDGTSSRTLRLLNVTDSTVRSLGTSGYGRFALQGDTYAFLNKRPEHYVFGRIDSKPVVVPGSRDRLGKAGRAGIGKSVAIAKDGTIFVAGQKGIGSGEYLYATQGKKWYLVRSPNGESLKASDVVAGEYLIAFRTGERNQTTVGYAIFGEKIDLKAISVE